MLPPLSQITKGDAVIDGDFMPGVPRDSLFGVLLGVRFSVCFGLLAKFLDEPDMPGDRGLGDCSSLEELVGSAASALSAFILFSAWWCSSSGV